MTDAKFSSSSQVVTHESNEYDLSSDDEEQEKPLPLKTVSVASKKVQNKYFLYVLNFFHHLQVFANAFMDNKDFKIFLTSGLSGPSW